MKTCIVLFLLIVAGFNGCADQRVDEVIKRVDSASLSSLNNISIFYRSKGGERGTSIYMVADLSIDCAPYAVQVSRKDPQDIHIKRHLVLRSCGKDYMTNNEIESAMQTYLNLEVFDLTIDSLGNIFINPNEKIARPSLLKVNDASGIKNLDEYNLVRDNWYEKTKSKL